MKNGYATCEVDGCEEHVTSEVFWPQCWPVKFCGSHTRYAEILARRKGVAIVVLPIYQLERSN